MDVTLAVEDGNAKLVDIVDEPQPHPIGTSRNKNVTFGQKSFQGRKQWPAKVHIKLRNTRPPFIKKIFLTKTFSVLP